MATISFRVTDAQKVELEERSNGNVSDYVKSVLFERQDVLNQILDRLELGTGRHESTSSDARKIEASELQSMLAEALMLLRFTVKPDTKRAVHAELNRLGQSIWHADADKALER